MKLLITGSNGFLGKALVSKLSAIYQLNCIARKDDEYLDSVANQIFSLDINSNTCYRNCFEGVDCVIHCAARVHLMDDNSSDPLNDYREVNTFGTLNLAKQAVESGVKRFIFISSIKANGEHTNEFSPFSTRSPLNPKDFYGQSKSEAEVQLMALADETGLEVVIIRPTLVYGPGVKGNFASLMKWVSKGLPLPFGLIETNRRSLVSLTNLVDLVYTCIEHPRARNQIFLVSDDNDVSTSEIIRQISTALGKKNFQLPVPIWCHLFVGKIFNKEDVVNRLLGSLQVDISHTKETLGWTPPQSLEAGFREAANAFLQSNRK